MSKKQQAQPKQKSRKQKRPTPTPKTAPAAESLPVTSAVESLALNGELDGHRTGRRLRQTAVLQMQRRRGNGYVRNLIRPGKNKGSLTESSTKPEIQRQATVGTDTGTSYEELLNREINSTKKLRDHYDTPVTSWVFNYYWRLALLLEKMNHDSFTSSEDVNAFIDAANELAGSEDDTLENLPNRIQVIEENPQGFPHHWADKVHYSLYIPLNPNELKQQENFAWQQLQQVMNRVPSGILEKGLPVNLAEARTLTGFELAGDYINLGYDHVVKDAAIQTRRYQAAVGGSSSIPLWNRFVEGFSEEIRSGKQYVDAESLRLTEQLVKSEDPIALMQSDSFQEYEKLDWYFTALHQEANRFSFVMAGSSLLDVMTGWSKGRALFAEKLLETDSRIASESNTSKLFRAISWALERSYFSAAALEFWQTLRDNLTEVILKAILTFTAITIAQFVPFLNVAVDAYLAYKFGLAAIEGAIEIISIFKSIFGASSAVDLQKGAARLATGSIDGIKFIVEHFVTKGARKLGKKIKDRRNQKRDAGKPKQSQAEDKPAQEPKAGQSSGQGKSKPEQRKLPRLSQSTEQQITEIMGEHPNLSRINAETALTGPKGSFADTLSGKAGEGGDIVFKTRGENGTTILRREVKVVEGGQNSFNSDIKHAAKQVKYGGEVLVQVPAGTDALRRILRFRGQRQAHQLGRYRSVQIKIVDPSGKVLFDGPLVM